MEHIYVDRLATSDIGHFRSIEGDRFNMHSTSSKCEHLYRLPTMLNPGCSRRLYSTSMRRSVLSWSYLVVNCTEGAIRCALADLNFSIH